MTYTIKVQNLKPNIEKEIQICRTQTNVNSSEPNQFKFIEGKKKKISKTTYKRYFQQTLKFHIKKQTKVN